MRLLLLNPRRLFRYHVTVVREMNTFDGLASDVSLATAARRVLAVALVALGAFADDLTIDVRRIVWADVGSACSRLVEMAQRIASRRHTAAAVRDWLA